jgi:hypothetical protein
MRPLSPQDILASWERGSHQGVLERAIALLSKACPEATLAELAALPIDERDHLLLELRVLSFGPRLEAVAACPACGEWLEFELPAGELLAVPTSLELGSEVVAEVEGAHLVARVPTTEDLLAVRAAGSRGETCLLERCVQCVVGDEASEAQRRAAFELLARTRPNLEVLLELECASCEHGWPERFEPGEYLWLEVRAQARRLLLDIHTLASSYGWREADVLAMTTTRRHAYLTMVGT